MANDAAQALAALDQALAQAPAPAPALLATTTRHLTALRRAAPATPHLNAIISVIMAGQFPLGPVPWDELRKAREWLAGIERE
jgi:hypothetical protein